MKLTNSLVSIVLTSYNAETTLTRCLDSILTQSYFPVEVILVDDASRDKTYKIARAYKSLDSRIRVYRNKKRYGPAVCFNRGLKRAKGQFVTFMNANDYISRQKLKKQVTFLLKESKIVAVGTQASFADTAGKILRKSTYPLLHNEIYQKMLHGVPMRFESALINRALLPKDLLKFTTNTYPFIYSGVFMKMMQYGKLANLSHPLYTHCEIQKPAYRFQRKPAFMVSFLTQLIESFYDHDYRPSFIILIQGLMSSFKNISFSLPRIFPRFRSA